jgi:hypothetical protein
MGAGHGVNGWQLLAPYPWHTATHGAGLAHRRPHLRAAHCLH